MANPKVEGVSTEELEEEPPTDKTCPFPDCGRKFPNDEMLKAHMERRHNESQ